MIQDAALIALFSTLAFCGLCLIQDRPRGALLGQLGAAAAALVLMVSLSLDGPVLGFPLLTISALGVGLFAAATSGMFYHLYLGRFTSVWKARGVFAAVYLGFSALLGIVFLSLI